MIEKGIASLDKALTVEQLADLHKDAKVRMLKDKQRRDAKKDKLRAEKEAQKAELERFGDMKQVFDD